MSCAYLQVAGVAVAGQDNPTEGPAIECTVSMHDVYTPLQNVSGLEMPRADLIACFAVLFACACLMALRPVGRHSLSVMPHKSCSTLLDALIQGNDA